MSYFPDMQAIIPSISRKIYLGKSPSVAKQDTPYPLFPKCSVQAVGTIYSTIGGLSTLCTCSRKLMAAAAGVRSTLAQGSTSEFMAIGVPQSNDAYTRPAHVAASLACSGLPRRLLRALGSFSVRRREPRGLWPLAERYLEPLCSSTCVQARRRYQRSLHIFCSLRGSRR